MNMKRNLLLLCALLGASLELQAQFDYTTNADGDSVTITSYTGASNDVTIPSTLNGLLVTSIGSAAFYESGITSVTIPDSVTSIGYYAFDGCVNLSNVTIPDSVLDMGTNAFFGCSSLTGVTIPDSVISIGDFAFGSCALTNVMIGSGVTSIGNHAFFTCTKLTNVTLGNAVMSIGGYAFCGEEFHDTRQGPTGFLIGCPLKSVTIPASVTSIGSYAFAASSNLTAVYFQGNSPSADSTVFNDDPATAYYLPGTAGWNSTFGGLTTALWTLPYPLILNFEPSFGAQSNGFGFTVSWATNLSVVVEATPSLVNTNWQPLQTNTLANGSFYFSDPQWTNYSGRFYRVATQ
jgi:hypothetical protein